MPGKGKITQTGKLGDVMKESIETAYSVVRAHSKELGINPEVFGEDRHSCSCSGGATPKDGPSAGIAMYTTLVSVLTKIPVRKDVAMTGEIDAAGQGAADRRLEGAAFGAARRHQDRNYSERERKGPGGNSRKRQDLA